LTRKEAFTKVPRMPGNSFLSLKREKKKCGGREKKSFCG